MKILVAIMMLFLAVPLDLVKVIETRASQVIVEGKSVGVVTVSISKEKIKAGFTSQRYKYNLKQKTFILKEAVPIEIER